MQLMVQTGRNGEVSLITKLAQKLYLVSVTQYIDVVMSQLLFIHILLNMYVFEYFQQKFLHTAPLRWTLKGPHQKDMVINTHLQTRLLTSPEQLLHPEDPEGWCCSYPRSQSCTERHAM